MISTFEKNVRCSDKVIAFSKSKTMTDNDNNVNSIFTYDDSVLDVFEDMAIYPDPRAKIR